MIKFLVSGAVLAVLLLIPPAFAAKAEIGVAASPEETKTGKLTLSDLTTEEVETYHYGEISTGSLIGGGLLGTFVGMGTGHIVYGKYGSRGWIFTVGELGSLGLAMGGATAGITGCIAGSADRCSNGLGLYVVGMLAYFGFRVWEIIDVWTLPGSHNSHYRAVKARVDGKEIGGRGVIILPLVAQSSQLTPSLGLQLGLRF